jgi:hypothetical protein
MVATTAATDQNAPVASAVSTRAASTSANEELMAATTCPAAKTTSVSTSVRRRGRRSVAIAIVGALTTMPTANAVISSPAWATLTFRLPAISSSSPATRNSVVLIRNVPSASSTTTNGSFGRCSVCSTARDME